jgi:hypothetical protein
MVRSMWLGDWLSKSPAYNAIYETLKYLSLIIPCSSLISRSFVDSEVFRFSYEQYTDYLVWEDGGTEFDECTE